MKDYIVSVFPLNTPSFEKSLPLALADRLSQYFSTQDDPTVILGDQHRRVQASISVLASLSSLSLPKHMRKPLIAEGASADIEGKFGTQHTPEQSRKSVKSVVSAVRTIDTKILAELGLHPPRSADDIITIEERLLSDLKVILMVCDYWYLCGGCHLTASRNPWTFSGGQAWRPISKGPMSLFLQI